MHAVFNIHGFVVAAFVLLTIRGFFHKNQKQYHKFSALQAA